MGTITLNGTYASAVIFNAKNHPIEDYAKAQLQMLCNHPSAKGSKIRVMPDVHPGKVGTIGLTMTVGEQILPALTGIDAGCGMTLARIKGKVRDFQKLDAVLRERIPAGFAVRRTPHRLAEEFDFTRLLCHDHIHPEKAMLSAGTLGSGNHFIEVDQDSEKNPYLVIHSGSRHLGKEVTDYYMNEGVKQLREKGVDLPYELTYLEGSLKDDYIHDVAVLTEYAALNRRIMLQEICKGMKWKIEETFSCIHNYIDTSDSLQKQSGAPILRKGAISARKGEKVIIPINMKEGIILGTGLGNPDWNYSAPHGSGRIYKREEVKNHFTVSAFKNAMKGIYSSSIGPGTLDEAPFAYRGMEEIKEVIEETVQIDAILKPIFNFKASKEN